MTKTEAKRQANITGMRYESESLKKENIRLSGEIEYFGNVAQNMKDKIKNHAIQMNNNLDRQFQLEDTINDYI